MGVPGESGREIAVDGKIKTKGKRNWSLREKLAL